MTARFEQSRAGGPGAGQGACPTSCTSGRGREELRPGRLRACATEVIYLLLAAVYLIYLPHADFVLDDWWLFQKFERAHGPQAQREMAAALIQNTVWGAFRTNGLSFLAVFGLHRAAGARPKFYFVFGLLLHVATAFLLYRVLTKLGLDLRLAFASGALFVLLPTAHNPLFWFPSCAHYLFSTFWFLVYLNSVAGTVVERRLDFRAGLVQVAALTLALFSGDQAFGLLLVGALWLAICFRSRAALLSAFLAWLTIAAGEWTYVRFINKAPIAGTMAAKLDFSLGRVLNNVRSIAADYERLLGGGYYHVSTIGWGWAAATAMGLLVWWGARLVKPDGQAGMPVLLGAGLWAAAYAPVLILRWRELRYDYVPSLGLAIFVAALIVQLPRRLFPAAAGALVAYCAATAVAEIQQCWRPQAQNLRAVEQQLRQLKDVRYHEIVAVSNTPNTIGTAPHFAMSLSYSSTPFVETVTGVWGLLVGRDISYDSGRLGLEHVDFFHELKPDDVRRAHVVRCETLTSCSIRTLMAREIGLEQYEVYPLKNYAGPAVEPGHVYSREELRGFERDLYFCKKGR